MKRKINILILPIILFSIFIFLFDNKCNAITQQISSDINSIDTKKYPQLKEKIEQLKKEYPNWNFKIFYTGIDWEDAIAHEYTGHGQSPKNLVPDNSSYIGEWICDICKDITYDSGSWKCASNSAIKYMMDSRVFLNNNDIFQFLELSYNDKTGYSKETLKAMARGSFLDNDNYINQIIISCKKYNVNPYYIIARIIQEQGKNGSVLVKGQGYNGQYVGYYNVFNIGASGSGKEKIILNGLSKAKKNGWTSMELSIDGGIKIISSNYIAVGQNTLYFQKFDVENSDGKLYWHQYMQNILAAQSEGKTLRKTFNNISALDNAYTFIIPIYENMPNSITKKPSITVSNVTVNMLEDGNLVKINVDTSLRMRNEPSGSITIGYLHSNEVATRLQKAETKINGTYWDKILKSDGTEGFVARCTFDGETPYKDYLIPIEEDLKDEKIINNNNEANTKIVDSNISDELNNEEKDIKNDEKDSFIKGDVNKDGKITSSDYVLIKNHIMGTNKLLEECQEYADYNKDGKITSSDYVLIKNYIMSK